MSILIKGMEMPKNCDNCFLPLRHCPYAMKPDGKCPLVPVPPHGRLIDADALIQKLNDEHIPYNSDLNFFIMDTPTIIEAEEGET